MKNYCPDLFTGMFIEKLDEDNIYLAHCCVSKKSSPAKIIDMNHLDLQQSRKFFLDTGELPDDCMYCKNSEKDSGTSRRVERYNSFAKNNEFPIKIQLEKLDYNCDNICNLKCITCTGGYSSAWLEDEVKLGLRQTSNIKRTNTNNLFENLDISQLNSVYFSGGEPLMTKDHINVLNGIVENGVPDNISISYSSNGTFFPTQEIIELWKKFKKVQINFSIDAVGAVFEYIRYPANWKSVEQNLLEYKKLEIPNFEVGILATIGVHNILYYDELYNWCINNNYNISVHNVVGQTGLSTLNFPLEHKKYLLNYLNNLPESGSKNYLLLLADSITSPMFAWVDYLNNIDSIRNNDWKIELKKLYELDPLKFQDAPNKITWYDFINPNPTPPVLGGTLVYNFKTPTNESKQIKIELAKTEFTHRWQNYLLNVSKDIPKISWSITNAGCKITNREETPRIELLIGLLNSFKFLHSNIDVNFQQEISDLEHIIKNPKSLRQQHLNTWHRHYTTQLSRFYQGEFGTTENMHNAIQTLNQNVHDLEISTYYLLKHKDLIENKCFFYVNCTDSKEFDVKYKLFGGNNAVNLEKDSFNPLTDDYNYTVWLNEDIQGKDQFKAWIEEDDLTQDDCTGNLFMTPNIMLDPNKIFKSIIDHPEWRDQHVKSGKPLNRWPIGNIINLDNIDWDSFKDSLIVSVELDGAVLWQK